MAHTVTPQTHSRRTMKVRFFQERNLSMLQDQLNEWLDERTDREIVEIRQSVLAEPGSRGVVDREIIVSIWYIED